jgi:hypothetical protein
MYNDSWSATLHGVAASHSQKLRRDTADKYRLALQEMCVMRIAPAAAVIAVVLAGAVAAQTPPAAAQEKTAAPAASPAGPQTARIGTMSELMVHLIYPTSDAVFYISSRTPTTEAEWVELQAKTLTLAESANLLMMPGRARDQDRWMKDARLMLDAGWAAFKAAKAKDVPALEALSDQMYEACTTCHQHYRPGYGQRPPPVAR